MNQLSPNLFMQPLAMDNQFRYTDEELIARFQEGDEQAYTELVNRYRDKLITFVYRFVNEFEKAEDIVQDALFKLYTHKPVSYTHLRAHETPGQDRMPASA